MKITLYTRQGCCLCEEAERVLAAARSRALFDLEKIDIDTGPELRKLYNDEIPVVAINGRKVFQYRFTLDDFLKRLAAMP